MNPELRRSFRLVCAPAEMPAVEALLAAQGFIFEPEPFCTLARKLLCEPFPLGRSLAAFFGLIYIQDRSSMLPPLALTPPPGSRVLDMCASPGSKTGLLAQLVGPSGLVLGNEPTRTRLTTLRRNLLALNLLQTVTCCWPGEALPLSTGALPLSTRALTLSTGALAASGQGWDFILLDPPCSGWGTTDKHPQVLKLWKGDKLKPLVSLQRRLLAEAARLLNPGGKLVYSTCTTNREENEEQTLFAMDELGLTLHPLEQPRGFGLASPLNPRCNGVLRVDEQASNAQGFYVAGFTKPSALCTAPNRTEEKAQGNNSRLQDNNLSLQGNNPSLQGAVLDISTTAISQPSNRATAPYEPLPKAILRDFGLDPDRLPPGSVGVFGDTVHFLPQLALDHLPAGLRWQGPALGKVSGGNVIPSPRLRALLDPASTHIARVDLDDTRAIDGLLQGQSLNTGLPGKEAALFWQGLALGRLRLKNGRALWAEK